MCFLESVSTLRNGLAGIADLECVMKCVFQAWPKTELSMIHSNGHGDVHSHVIIAVLQTLNE